MPEDPKAAPAADPASPVDPAQHVEPEIDPKPAAAEDPAALKAKLEKSVAAEKSLRDRLKKIEAEKDEAARKEAEKRGEYEKLYGSEKSRAEQLAQENERLRKVAASARERDLLSVPEHLRPFAPEDPEKFVEFVAAARTAPPVTPKSTTAQTPKPGTGDPQTPPEFTARDAQEIAMTRDPKRKAELAAKRSAWNQHLAKA